MAISFRLRGLTFEAISRSKPTMKACKLVQVLDSSLLASEVWTQALKKALRGALAEASGHGIGMEHVSWLTLFQQSPFVVTLQTRWR